VPEERGRRPKPRAPEDHPAKCHERVREKMSRRGIEPTQRCKRSLQADYPRAVAMCRGIWPTEGQIGTAASLVSYNAGLATTRQRSQSIFGQLEHDSRVPAEHDTYPVLG
jgi:hypothetical protein